MNRSINQPSKAEKERNQEAARITHLLLKRTLKPSTDSDPLNSA
jgi:hypothetical protein